jgi:hypothetical protein
VTCSSCEEGECSAELVSQGSGMSRAENFLFFMVCQVIQDQR